MKKLQFVIAAGLLLFVVNANAQFGDLLDKVKKDSSAGKVSGLLKSVTGGKGSLSNDEVVAGLKEALSVGTNKSVTRLSALDGYFGNADIKILMPEEAKKAERTLRSIGLDKQVDDAIMAMNRAAEDAAKSAAPIFLNAIKSISIQDGFNILKGNNTAATEYLKGKTTASLTQAFKPVVQQSLQKVDATKYWNDVFSAYNKLPMVSKVNPDLTAYVTERALAGLFFQVAEEEKQIRQDPTARVTDILKKVFAQ